VGADPDALEPDGGRALVAELLGGEHLETRAPPIDREHATPSTAIVTGADTLALESPETTHFSIVDAKGNAVSCTYTQSASFGSKVMIPGTGVLLGNAMGAFSPKGPNVLSPGKRMASSMTPAIATEGGKLAIVFGSPGGDSIPSTVAQVFRNLVDGGMTIDEAVAHARVLHAYLPDHVRIERGNAPSRAVLTELEKRGHVIEPELSSLGDANSILVDVATGVAWGATDPREGGKAEGVAKPKP
jgi:gamma-glutamyltranspeptidase/glutathione hydrolase